MQNTPQNEQVIMQEFIDGDSDAPTENIDVAREHIDTLIETACSNMNIIPTKEQQMMIKELVNQYLDHTKQSGYEKLTSHALAIYIMASVVKVTEMSKAGSKS